MAGAVANVAKWHRRRNGRRPSTPCRRSATRPLAEAPELHGAHCKLLFSRQAGVAKGR